MDETWINNVAWFYFTISGSGNFVVNLSAEIDIDYVVWGPFDNHDAAMEGCGTLQNVYDCSYSPSATENITFDDETMAGEIYILMMNNFAGEYA